MSKESIKGKKPAKSTIDNLNLHIDCKNCFALCCTALYFSASEGFPVDKAAGLPCPNLQSDFRCSIHQNLGRSGLKGCMAFECFGAGQKVSQVTFSGQDWRRVPELAGQMFDVFLIMRQLHEMLWYLKEALTLQPARSIRDELSFLLVETERHTRLVPELLLKLDVKAHRAKVNILLLRTSELVRSENSQGQMVFKKKIGQGADLIGSDLRRTNLRGANLRGAYLIAADLRGVDMSGADLIGADFRDADLRGADLSKSIFLTQAQVNAAKGDADTKLPPSLTQPEHWVTTKGQ